MALSTMALGQIERPLIRRWLWNIMSIIIFFIRKGLLKRKYIQEDLMRRGKLFSHNLRNLICNRTLPSSSGGLGLREYEFSCSNSPDFPCRKKLGSHKQWHHGCFGCIGFRSSQRQTEDSPSFAGMSLLNYTSRDNLEPCYLPAFEEENTRSSVEAYGLANGEELGSPVMDNSKEECNVDKEAEEFIASFYNQMKFQRQMSLLRYQEMLARGAS